MMNNAHARIKHRKEMNKRVQNEPRLNEFGFICLPSAEEIIKRSKELKVFSLEKNLKDKLMYLAYNSFFYDYPKPSTARDIGLINMKNYFDSLTVTEDNFLELYNDINLKLGRGWQ